MHPLSYLAQYHYLLGIMFAVGYTALAVSIVYYKRHKELRVFCFYMFFSMLQISSDMFAETAGSRWLWPKTVWAIATLWFLLYENVVCILYIRARLNSPRRRKITIGIAVFFGLTLALSIVFRLPLFSFMVADCVTLTVACFLYFYELFLRPHDQPLKDKPAFWVVTGTLFLNCLSIPLYLSATRTNLKDFNEFFSLNVLLYILLYSMLIRAYLCPPVKAVATVADVSKPAEFQEVIEPLYQ